MKKIASVQSNYIPWKGFFDMIAAVDEFILYDDMQYTRRDWRNRSRIITPHGLRWLTVPVMVKGRYHQKIRDTDIDGMEWASKHWQALVQNYCRAPHFDEIRTWLEPLYVADDNSDYLSAVNRRFIEAVCGYLNIKTWITNSWNYTPLVDGKTERLADLCVQASATEYVSGPSARGYIDERVFERLGIKLTWFDYAGYSEYPQLWGEFTHHVSILDLLFNCGKDAPRYMKCTHS